MKRYYVLDSDDLFEEKDCDPGHATAVVLASDADEAVKHEQGKLVDLKAEHRKEIQEMQREFQRELRDAVNEAVSNERAAAHFDHERY